METLNIIIIVIVVIILLWLIFRGSTKSRCLSQLNGMWMADEEFCNESGIDLMTFYFGDRPDAEKEEKLCWLLILNSNGQYNHITTMTIGKATHIKGNQYEFDVELQDVPDDIFNTTLKLRIVPGELITLIDDTTDTKIFEGQKNKQASDAIEFNTS